MKMATATETTNLLSYAHDFTNDLAAFETFNNTLGNRMKFRLFMKSKINNDEIELTIEELKPIKEEFMISLIEKSSPYINATDSYITARVKYNTHIVTTKVSTEPISDSIRSVMITVFQNLEKCNAILGRPFLMTLEVYSQITKTRIHFTLDEMLTFTTEEFTKLLQHTMKPTDSFYAELNKKLSYFTNP